MSSKGWKITTWGTLATLEYGKSLRDYQNSSGDVPVYGTNGLIGFTNAPLCNFPSVIIGRKGAYRGVHYSNKPFFVIDTAFYLKPQADNLDLLFAYYQLLTQDINSMDSGSAIPSTSREDFYNLEINLPPLPTQRRIAAILSALDDKIELNRQTNATLEVIAQTIFKEWFVEFRFPGATSKMDKSELEMIPQGWRVGKLGEIYKTTSGGTPSRSNPEFYEDGMIYWVKSKELNNSFITETEEKITEDALRKSSAKLLPAYSVLIAMYGATVGEFGIISMEAACNQAICAFLPNDEFPFTFIYHFLKNSKDEIISRAVGSAQQNISQDLLKQIDIVLPPKVLLSQFHKVVNPVFQAIENNIKQIAILAQIRDSLLPKLMSGEIEV